ncbi:Pyridine nucleotide-disulfide oxidoreductase, NAD-binding region domain protein [Rhodopirellula maiorica SM1]|uniref:Pyridine nucleotide-disulfide oxidoreductase, NAD-binding region domain protein n=1 Tax=Rhodopirellula maiorica SM1 TaxID=1265738 RepID=M5RS39_9BACT|nr:FAD-dependent oxidoreductase [Rhodopirellula maiorica]EMI22110.1 Pyridine nucleotide-disulfide oxidoreductase, NAD-binding region domain protein [Rhodopirellula maiorica SM1]
MNSEIATLDPPGSIAIVGAGPLGVEAALYGRFLGYNVSLIEARGRTFATRSL